MRLLPDGHERFGHAINLVTRPTGQVQRALVTPPLLSKSEVAEPAPPGTPPTFRSIEVFTGAGGLALGTHRAGFRHQLLLERDVDACATILTNAKAQIEPQIDTWSVEQTDIEEFDFRNAKDLDLVAGGAACQPFSIGGAGEGRRDPRNLLPEFVRVVRETAPRAFLLENVDGLLRPSFARYFEYVRLQLTHPEIKRRYREQWKTHLRRLSGAAGKTGLHYGVTFARLNAADFGVPQVRRRVFVVGLRSDCQTGFVFPRPTHTLDRLLYEQWVTQNYWERHEVATPRAAPANWAKRIKEVTTEPPADRPWVTVRDAVGHLPDPDVMPSPNLPQHILRRGARQYAGHSGSALDWPSKTIKAGNHGVPGGENMIHLDSGEVRYYTIREMAEIQTFPRRWLFSGEWTSVTRQLGNAVPVALAQVVAASIAEHLTRLETTAI